MAEKRRIIIDTDPGIDDAFAICYALACQEAFTIEGLTIVFGNSNDTMMLAQNAKRIVELCKSPQTPIYIGASGPLADKDDFENELVCLVHGKNALGDICLPPIDQKWQPGEESAWEFMNRLCSNSPGEITIVALGPLTNVAKAIQKNPDLSKQVKQIVFMGGAVKNPLGNKKPVAEANVCNDPEAAAIVLNSGCDIVMAGLDITHKTQMTSVLRSNLKESGAVGEFLANASQFYIDFHTTVGIADPPLHDVVPMVYLTHPQLFDGIKTCIHVECLGTYTRGMTVMDNVLDKSGKFGFGKKDNAFVLMHTDPRAFNDVFLSAIRKLDGNETKISTTSASSSSGLVTSQPRVGVACHVLNPQFPNCILVGTRMASHGIGSVAAPGGYLEPGESWEECAAREVKEETGLDVFNVTFFTVTNDVMINDNRHSVTIHMQAHCAPDAAPQALEPTKCSHWEWMKWDDIQQKPHFQPLKSLFERELNPTTATK